MPLFFPPPSVSGAVCGHGRWLPVRGSLVPGRDRGRPAPTAVSPGQGSRSREPGRSATVSLDRGLPTVMVVRDVPRWGLVSSVTAPVLLVGGWTAAASRQPPYFNSVTDTVSALAALGAADRWVMTLTFLAVGICNVVTGLALRPACSRPAWAGDLGGRGPSRNARRGVPPARRRLGGARDLGVGRLRRARGVAGRGMAARPFGAMGAAAGGVCLCRRGAWPSPRLGCVRGHHRRRTCWPGRADPWRGSGGLAADRGPVLPSPRQGGGKPDPARGLKRPCRPRRPPSGAQSVSGSPLDGRTTRAIRQPTAATQAPVARPRSIPLTKAERASWASSVPRKPPT